MDPNGPTWSDAVLGWTVGSIGVGSVRFTVSVSDGSSGAENGVFFFFSVRWDVEGYGDFRGKESGMCINVQLFKYKTYKYKYISKQKHI